MLKIPSDVVFGPEEIRVMRQALDKATQALAFAFAEGIDGETRSLLARSIISNASDGELRPSTLCALALRDMAPRAAVYVQTPAIHHADFRCVGRSGSAVEFVQLAPVQRHGLAREKLLG
jgi:hypothetical protein